MASAILAAMRKKPKLSRRSTMHTSEIAEPLPDGDDWYMKKGLVERKIISSMVTWKKMSIYLVEDALLFGNAPYPGRDQRFVIDFIPLHEVDLVSSGNQQGVTSGHEFVIHTAENGFNAGRNYVHRSTKEEVDAWVSAIDSAVKEAKKMHEKKLFKDRFGESKLKKYQAKALTWYESTKMQMFIALIITSSFASVTLEPERLLASFIALFIHYLLLSSTISSSHPLSPPLIHYPPLLHYLSPTLFTACLLTASPMCTGCVGGSNYVFTILFALELMFNMFARCTNGITEFYKDGWNVFDTFVVFVGIFTKAVETIPQLKLLRLVRIFRVTVQGMLSSLTSLQVVRLFKRVKSLNRIIKALVSSLLPVGNSFVLLLLVTCIWATLGTHIYHERSPIFFGNFLDSVFTMFQVVTGDSWASAVTRTLFHEDGSVDIGVAIFFVSYVIFAGVVLINIVVAVLLDEFISAVSLEKEELQRQGDRKKEQEGLASRVTGVLDPLSAAISEFYDYDDLTMKIVDTYNSLDTNASGGLDFEELQKGLKMLPTAKPIHIIKDDFDLITNGGEYCNEDGEFSAEQFQQVMRGKSHP
eukprot:766852-Hanusia_phi.AAC.3